MELKKSEKADLQKKRVLFLEIGLIVALAAVIAAFSWSMSEKVIELPPPEYGNVEEEIIDITRQDQRPQPVRQQIQVLSEIINIVKDDTQITQDIKFDDFLEDAVIVPESTNKVGDIVDFDPNDIFEGVLEDYPLFQGQDMNTFGPWVQRNSKYPESARRNRIEGRVTVSFVIEKDGTLSDINIINSPDESLSEEVKRVIASSPKWTPGKQFNRTVRFRFSIQVTFRLRN